eukprot:gene29112-32326_t
MRLSVAAPAAAAANGDTEVALVVSKTAPKIFTPVKTKEEVAGKAACQVAGCHRVLSNEKSYYQRYRCCEVHLRSLSIVINGSESRFCQQCGRFQELHEFDGVRRSCRSKLLSHKMRRRAVAMAGDDSPGASLSGDDSAKLVISIQPSIGGTEEEEVKTISQPLLVGEKSDQVMSDAWFSKHSDGDYLELDDDMGTDLDFVMSMDLEGLANFVSVPLAKDNFLASIQLGGPECKGADGSLACSMLHQGWQQGSAMDELVLGQKTASVCPKVSCADVKNEQAIMQNALQSMTNTTDIPMSLLTPMPPMNFNMNKSMISGNAPTFCPPKTSLAGGHQQPLPPRGAWGANLGNMNTSSGLNNGANLGNMNTSSGRNDGANFGNMNTSSGLNNGANFDNMNTSSGLNIGANLGNMNTSSGLNNGANLGNMNTSSGLNNGANLGNMNTSSGRNDGANFGNMNTSSGLNNGNMNTSSGRNYGSNFGNMNTSSGLNNGANLGNMNTRSGRQ